VWQVQGEEIGHQLLCGCPEGHGLWKHTTSTNLACSQGLQGVEVGVWWGGRKDYKVCSWSQASLLMRHAAKATAVRVVVWITISCRHAMHAERQTELSASILRRSL
jgi:hypothetical protein